jgi:hypothetical protein
MSLLSLQRTLCQYLVNGQDEIKDQIRGAALDRLAVYHHAYRAQLIDCLRDTFQRTREWLGDDRFDEAARQYIEATPPRSWSLNDYGSGFDRLLAKLYEEDAEVAELAWLDWALRRAFDGADAVPISTDQLADINWDSVSLQLHPTLQMTNISTNSAAIWTALSAGEKPPAPLPLPAPAAMRVWRKELSPRFRTIKPVEHSALRLAISGASFATICSMIGDPPERAGALLATWLQDGLIIAVA